VRWLPQLARKAEAGGQKTNFSSGFFNFHNQVSMFGSDLLRFPLTFPL
jgi:hypothetical protein